MRVNLLTVVYGLAVLAVWQTASWAQSEARSIAEITPRGVQRGNRVTLTFHGGGLAESQELVFYRPGVRTIRLESGELERDGGAELKATLEVAQDCPLGQHAVRVRTTKGLTTLHTFYVGAYPHIDERAQATTFEDPQKVGLNVTVNGDVGGIGEVDYYQVAGKIGQRITAEVRAVRLAQTLFDAHVAILGPDGRTLVESDDTGLGFQDPIASLISPVDGAYRVAVRESGYGSEGDYKRPQGQYLLYVGTFPRPLSVVPAGGPPGAEVEFRFLGDQGGSFTRRVKLPRLDRTMAGIAKVIPVQDGLLSPTPHAVRVGPHANVLEAEPNNDWLHATATDASPPIAFNGVIATRGDVDCVRFSVVKGQRFVVQVYGRRIGSRLDSLLTIVDPEGNVAASNDDPSRRFHTSVYRYNDHHAGAFAEDSYLEFTAAMDGAYVAQVADHLRKGGVDYHYRVEVAPLDPEVYLWVRRKPPYWRGTPGQSISVPRGNRYAAVLSHRKVGCPEEVFVQPNTLPAGVKFTTVALQDGETPVLFEAAADAPLAATLTGFASQSPAFQARIATHYEQSVFYGLNPPNYCFYGVDNDRLAVSVAEEFPVKLDLAEPSAPLLQDGAITLKVVAQRDPSFHQPVQLEMLYHPTGISSILSDKLEAGRSEVSIPIEADVSAQPGSHPIAIVARTATQLHGGGVSTQLRSLNVAAAFMDVKLLRASGKMGETVLVRGEVTHKRPFDGTATLILRGLPQGVIAEKIEFTKNAALIEVPVTITAACRVGTYKTLFCEISIREQGAAMVHKLGSGGVLRVFESVDGSPRID